MEFLTDFTVQELEARLVELGVEKWRARPILLWVHRRNAVTFEVTPGQVESNGQFPHRSRTQNLCANVGRIGNDGVKAQSLFLHSWLQEVHL